MNQDFPFDQFLKSNKENQASNTHNNNKNLKEFKLENITSSMPQNEQEMQINTNIESDFSSDELNILNQELLSFVQTQVTPEKYNAFFDGSFNLTNITMDSVHFSVTTNFIKTMIQNHYKGIIRNGIFQVLGKEFEVLVDVIGAAQLKPATEKPKENINLSQFLETTETTKPQIKSVSEAKFTLDLNPTKDDLLSKVESQYIDHMNPEDTGVIIDPKKIFDNFIVGPSNNLACASAVAITNQPGNKGKYLYI